MTLLITCTAAVISTVIWYLSPRARRLGIGTLSLMYWGASLMWLVDLAAEFAEERAEVFQPAANDMMNDAFLGLSAVLLGMVIWVVAVLVRDPDGIVRGVLFKGSRK